MSFGPRVHNTRRPLVDAKIEPDSDRDHGPGRAGFGVIKKPTHARGFIPLDGDRSLVTPDVIAAFKVRQHGFIMSRVRFQPRDTCLDHLAEPDADLELVRMCAANLEGHGELPLSGPQMQASNSTLLRCRY